MALKETSEFKAIFEQKNTTLKAQYTELLEYHNDLRQRLVSFEELLKVCNEKIDY